MLSRFYLLSLFILTTVSNFGLAARDLNDFALGLNTHFLGQPVNDELRNLSICKTRSDLNWKRVSDPHGIIDPENKTYESILHAPAFISDPLVVLAYGHPAFDGGGRIVSDTGRAAYLSYALSSIQRLQAKTQFYEIWNEWNGPGMGGAPISEGKGKVSDYVSLLKESYAGIKLKFPETIILGGATTEIGKEDNYMHEAMKEGLLDNCDGISIHPYIAGMHLPEEHLIELIKTLKNWLSDYPKYKSKPIYVTEIGWSTYVSKNQMGVDYIKQAKYMARSILLLAADPQIKGAWIYELRDGGTDPQNAECHFGLLENDGKPKPSYFVIKELAQLLRDSTTIQQMPTVSSDQIYFMKLTDATGTSKIICWSVQPNTHWKIRINAAKNSVIHAHEIGAADIVLKADRPSNAASNPLSSYVLGIPDMPVVISGLSQRDTFEPFTP